MLKIYGSDLSSPSNKVRFTANAIKAPYEYIRVNLREGEHRKPEFLKLHPAGKVPVIDDNGFVLFESNAIIRYLAVKNNSDLYPQDVQPKAVVDQWIDFGSHHVGQATSKVVFNRLFAPRLGLPVDENSLKDGLMWLDRFLPVVDRQIGARGFLIGDRLSLADINLLSVLDPVDMAQIDISPYANLVRWRRALQQQEFYQACHKEFGAILKTANVHK